MAYLVRSETSISTGTIHTPSIPLFDAGDALFLFVVANAGPSINLASATVTISSANPGVVAYADAVDKYYDGQQVYLTTTGALPGTLAINTTYYVRDYDSAANTFRLAATSGGTAIDTSSSAGSGTHTIYTCAFGWTLLGPAVASGGSSSVFFYIANCPAGTLAPTIVLSSSRGISCISSVVKDAHATAPISVFARSDYTTTNPTLPALSTVPAGSFVLYGIGFNGAPYYNFDAEKVVFITTATNSTNVRAVTCWQNAYVAGDVSAVTGSSSAGGGNCWGVAIAPANSSAPQLRGGIGKKADVVQLNGVWPDPQTFLAPNAAPMSISTLEGYPTHTATTITDTGQYRSVDTTTLPNVWTGGWRDFTAIDLQGKILSVRWTTSTDTNTTTNSRGIAFLVADSAGNWRAYRLALYKGQIFDNTYYMSFIDLDDGVYFASSGTLDLSDVTYFGFFWARIGTNSRSVNYNAIHSHGSAVAVGGTTARPLDWKDVNFSIASELVTTVVVFAFDGIPSQLMSKQGSQQLILQTGLQIGDGGITPTVVNLTGCSLETPLPYSLNFLWNVANNKLALTMYPGEDDVFDLSGTIMRANSPQNFVIHASASTSCTFLTAGLALIGWGAVTWKTGIPCSRVSFAQCGTIDGKAATISSCEISASTGTYAIALDAGASIAGTSFTKSSDTYAMNLREAGTYNLEGCTFSGYTTPVKVTAVSGTVTLQLAAGQSEPAYSSDGATVVYSQPQQEYGISISDLIAGSQVVIYEAGTTTEVDRDDNTGTTYEWTELGSSLEVDYTIQKTGYLPQRFAGLTLTSVQESSGNQLVDRAYVASSGLTFGSTGTVTVGTKLFGLTTASTGKNWYSFLIESWIAQSSLRNVDFPVLHDGDESFTLIDGWEFSSTNWQNLRRCGFRYLSTSSVQTATFSGLLSIGDIGSNTAQLQQTDGGTQAAARTSGDIDQMLQVYGDSTHGDIDYTDHLVLKAQVNGYITAAYDVVADSELSALGDKLYSFPLSLVDAGIATGDPGITGVTITDHGASPVTWNSKEFSITITDSGSNSGEDIARWINYNLAQGGTFQGKAAFNWHDMVLPNGDGYKTIRGPIYGDTGAALKGVRVLRGTDAHPDFNLYTADDGTTYAPPQLASVTISGAVVGSLIQLWDTVADEELYIGTGPYYWSETYTADRTIRLRAMYCDEDSATIFKEEIIGNITEASPTLVYLLSQATDNVYAANAIDGSTVTGITIDDSHLLIEVDSASISYPEIYAYETYWLSTEAGIRDETRIITATDTANYIFSGFKIKNIGTGPLLITGGYGRDADTGSVLDMMDTAGLSIFPAPDHVVPYAAGAEATIATVQAGLTAQGYSGARATKIDNLDVAVSTAGGESSTDIATAVRTELSTELGDISFMNKVLKNKREMDQNNLTVYDDDGATPILQKALADINGNPIATIASGIAVREAPSSV